MKRIGYLASEIVKHGGICIVANIAPYTEDRLYNKNLISQFGKYVQVYVNTSLEICEERDCKGLYQMARNGQIKNFTGISDPFEEPSESDLILDGDNDLNHNVDLVIKLIKDNL